MSPDKNRIFAGLPTSVKHKRRLPVKMALTFKNKYGSYAFIAGASEGLGAAFAESLAKRKLNLVLVARRAEKLAKLSKDLEVRYQIKVVHQSLDLSDIESTINYVDQLKVDIGLFVYNAAYAPIGYFENIQKNHLTNVVDVNIKAPLLLCDFFTKKMIQRKKGGIILMSSLAGTQGSPKIATYAASKAFNTIFAEGLWRELKPHGIDVIASVAGAIRTPGYNRAKDEKEAPGTLDAEAVAEKTLKALGDGPTVIPGWTNKLAHFFLGRILPRKWAIKIMERNTKDLE